MSATEVAASLKAANAAITAGEYKDALQHCKTVLKADKKSTDALILIGKAAYHLKEYQQAELAYRRALETKPSLLEAWQGLAEVFKASNNTSGEIEANERLVRDQPFIHRIASFSTKIHNHPVTALQCPHTAPTHSRRRPPRSRHSSQPRIRLLSRWFTRPSPPPIPPSSFFLVPLLHPSPPLHSLFSRRRPPSTRSSSRGRGSTTQIGYRNCSTIIGRGRGSMPGV